MTPRKKVLRFIFWIVTGLISFFVVAAFFLPRKVNVTRAGIVAAPADQVLAAIVKFKRWPEWGPWFKRDVFIETKFDGESSAAGAMMFWSGESVGEGRARITAVSPGSLKIAVRFGEGMIAGQSQMSSALDDLKGRDGRDAELFIEIREVSGGSEVKFHFRIDFGQNLARRYFALGVPSTARQDFDECLVNLNSLLAKSAP